MKFDRFDWFMVTIVLMVLAACGVFYFIGLSHAHLGNPPAV